MGNKIFTFLIFVSIFFCSYTFFSHPFEAYFHYIIFLLLLPFFIVKYGLPIVTIQILTFPLLFGLIQVQLGNNTIELLMKIFLGVFISTSFYYYVMVSYDFDVEKLFVYYLKGAYFVTLIGYFQLFSYYVKFEPGYQLFGLFNKWSVVFDAEGLRMNSILPEASQMALIISPAAFIAFHNLLLRKKLYYRNYESILIILAVVLTTSSLGLVGFFLILAYLTINYGKAVNLLVGLVALLLIGNIFYIYLPDFHSRFDSTWGLWVNHEFTLKNVNNSSFILFNHAHVAWENFKNNILFGTGLGSHSFAFDKYSYNLLTEDVVRTSKQANSLSMFNTADANSMFLRLLSETGLMGIGSMFYILFRFYVKRDYNYPENNYWLISNAILVLIILYLLRQGNYFINGFPFFVWMYYYTYKANLKSRNVNSIPE